LVLLASLGAYRQFSVDYTWHKPYTAGSFSWWIHPVEWHVDAGLPDIGGNIRTVEVIRGRVFVAGDAGLLAFSQDNGRSWTQLRYSPANGSFTTPTTGGVSTNAQRRSSFDGTKFAALIVPTLHAAEKTPDKKSPTPNPPPQSQQPPPQAQQPPPQKQAPPPARNIDIAPPKAPGTVPNLDALYCLSSYCELLSDDNRAFASTDGGLSWRSVTKYEGASNHADLHGPIDRAHRDATMDSANHRAWVVDANGGLFRQEGVADSSTPIGDALIPVTRAAAASLPNHTALQSGERYGRFLPPWYLALILICGLVLTVRDDAPEASEVGESETSAEPEIESGEAPPRSFAPTGGSIASQAISDRPLAPVASERTSTIGNQGTADKPLAPGEPDALDLGVIATGLSFFLRNEKTKPPLVLAVNGRWGSGKSSLMNLLRGSLEEYGGHPVWFNAWHHQNDEQLLTALLETVKTQGIPPLATLAGWSFRVRLAWKRLQRYWVQLALLLVGVTVLWRVEVRLRQSGLSIGGILSRLLNWTRDAPTKLAADRASSALAAAKALQETARTVPNPQQAAQLNAEAARFLSAATPPPTHVPPIVDDAISWVQDSSVLALFAAALAAIKTATRGLRAFATSPASLLALESGNTNAKDLQEQTSFRQQFADEFSDVTRALGRNRRMLILIDDLDRCRPEKVREVLEAVNFLVSNGECFVVLGMARDMVEHCVGLSFRRVVDTMPWKAFDLSQEDIERYLRSARLSIPPGSSERRADLTAKRRAFAHLFLDKLVQIDVSIPEPTPMQKKKLFESEEERKAQQAAELRVDRWLAVLKIGSNTVARAAQAAVLLLVVVGGGLQVGSAIVPVLDSLTVVDTPAQISTAASTTTTAAVPVAAVPDAIRTVTAPKIVAGISAPSATWLGAWPIYVAVFGVFAVASALLRRPSQQRVSDARPFTNALAVWHPLVMTTGAHNTPRAARRFQNKVRYLAMRQRALRLGPPTPPVEWLVRWMLKTPALRPDPLLQLFEKAEFLPESANDIAQIAEWLRLGTEGNTGLAAVKLQSNGPEIVVHRTGIAADVVRALAVGDVQIPETMLVALAAIHEFEPGWIEDPTRFEAIVVSMSPTNLGAAAFLEARTRHCAYWDNWKNLTHYRRAYLRLCSDIDTSADDARPGSSPAFVRT
jgi:hypothetical protein